MRIIAGTLGGRRFYPPADKWPTRPTTDIAKEGLFNILQNQLDFSSVKMLDLFGGTGSHSLEFISRGCQDTTYVDKFGPCVRFISQLTQELKINDKIQINKADVFQFIKNSNSSFDYIFAGPPYPLTNIPDIPDLIFDNNLLDPDGLLVLEHNPQHNFEGHRNYQSHRNYGTTIFSFFRANKNNL